MKKTISLIIGLAAFITLVGCDNDSIEETLYIKSISFGVLMFILWINGAYQKKDESTER